MNRTGRWLAAGLGVIAIAITACGQTDEPVSAAPSPPATAREFAAALCVAFDEFTLAVGNDAGAKGPEAAALAKAIEDRDAPAIAAAILAVRAHAAEFGRLGRLMASGWEPGRTLAGVVVALADTILADLATLETGARAGRFPAGREYIGEAAYPLYQRLFTEGRALSSRYRGQFGDCPRPNESSPSLLP